MYLYLVRHGNASAANRDSDRSLSSVGVDEVKSLSDYLLRHKVDQEINVVLHSGILRAQQTAEILGKALNVPVEKMAGIQSEDPAELILPALETWTQSALLVSHLPYLPKLIWVLTGENRELPTAGCVCLKKGEGRWQLEWFYDPSDTRHS